MITFIPKKNEGNARAGVRAACRIVLCIMLLPFAYIYMLYDKYVIQPKITKRKP